MGGLCYVSSDELDGCLRRKNRASMYSEFTDVQRHNTSATTVITFQASTTSEKKWAPNTTLLNEIAAAKSPIKLR